MSTTPPPQPQYGSSFPQQQQQKGCLGRNWKWLVPVGCLGLIIFVVVIVAGVLFVTVKAVKSSEVYQYALEKAKANPEVVEELGEPIKDGWLVQGSAETSGGSGHAKFQIPINGPKKSGTIYVEASKDPVAFGSDNWHYTTLEVGVEGRPGRIPLSEKKSLMPQSPEDDVEGDSDETDETDETEPPPPPPAPGENGATTPPSSGKTVSGGALDDKAISKPDPVYPAIGKAVKATGKVVVQVVVDESGDVISASAVSGHPLLQNSAVQAARQAKFTPMKLSGVAVKVTGTLTYNFVLE